MPRPANGETPDGSGLQRPRRNSDTPDANLAEEGSLHDGFHDFHRRASATGGVGGGSKGGLTRRPSHGSLLRRVQQPHNGYKHGQVR